jgi:ABC-type phosphate transport system substrate-binding protein
LGAALLALALVVAPSGRAPAEAEVKLAVIVNPAVPVTALNAAELSQIFTRAMRNWKDGTTIRALNLPPGSSERVEFDRVVLDMTPERSAQFWIDKQIRGQEGAPKAIGQADIVLHLVPTLAGSIGYVPEDKVDAKVRVVARIRGGRVMAP